VTIDESAARREAQLSMSAEALARWEAEKVAPTLDVPVTPPKLSLGGAAGAGRGKQKQNFRPRISERAKVRSNGRAAVWWPEAAGSSSDRTQFWMRFFKPWFGKRASATAALLPWLQVPGSLPRSLLPCERCGSVAPRHETAPSHPSRGRAADFK
jgi:hypothetical protein